MDYGELLQRTWKVVWNNKFLILLGIVVALGTSGPWGRGSGGGGTGYQEPGPSYPPSGEFQAPPGFPENSGELRELFDSLVREFEETTGIQVEMVGALVFIIIAVALLIGLTVWGMVVIARGGLIAGVNEIEVAGSSGLVPAVSAAWQRGWQLIGINLVPAIPNLILFLIGAGMFFSYFGSVDNYWDALTDLFTTGTGFSMLFGMGAVVCMGALVAIALDILRTFAERACMIEESNVFESYGRGWEVLRGNLAEALLLLLIQIGISIALWMVMFVPGFVMIICCLLWPLLLVIQGTIKTYFLTMWTLAWREWAGSEPGEGLMIEEAPAG